MMQKKWDSDWIYFSRRARRGIFVLLFLFIIIAVLPRLYYTFNPPKGFQVEMIPMEEEVDKVNDEKKTKYNQPEENFDPNFYDIEDWMKVGLSERQAQSILNYLDKVGSFKVKSDLKRLYVVDDELYELLKPKLDLPDTSPKKSIDHFESEEYKQVGERDNVESTYEDVEAHDKVYRKISVNKVSVEELQTIRGIGEFYAKEIVKLRERFGGLIYPEQLLSIYNLDEEKLAELKPYLTFDKSEVIKLNINSADFKELSKHPFISSDIAHWIVYYRENYGSFKGIDNLLLCPYIDVEKLKKIEPYVSVK